VVSSTGESDELMRIIPWLKKKKVKLIALTPSDRSSLARACDVLLKTQQPGNAADGFASYTSCISALAIGDLLGLSLLYAQDLEHGGAAPAAYARNAIHTVSDLIETRPLNPTSPENMIFKDALLELTAKGLGAISIVSPDGRLAGILTDGDIRRLLQRSQGSLTQLFLTNVSSVMTKNPRRIASDKTVFDALKMMEDNAITVLPVVDADGRPAGMIHLHDLVQMGLLHGKTAAAGKKKGEIKRGNR
jgi:arabinose-5-phosphate isomerase